MAIDQHVMDLSDPASRSDARWLRMIAAGSAATLGGASAVAGIVYTPLDVTVSTDSNVGVSDYTLVMPAVGSTSDGSSILTIAADTTNGVYGTKPSSGNAFSIRMYADQAYSGDAVASDPPVADLTAYAAGELLDSPLFVVSTQDSGTATPPDQPKYQIISADGTVGNFTAGSGVQYIGYERYYSSSQSYHGWIGVETLVADGNETTVHITGIAAESENQVPITAGAVPEPSSLALLALGAAGLVGYRKRSA